MPVLFLNWGALGPYGGVVTGTRTVDTGGVEVDVTVDGVTEGDIGVTINTTGYVAPGEPFNPDSHLKLFGDGLDPAGTPAGVRDVSTTTFDFSSTDAAFGDTVQNVQFRITDIDGAAVNDADGGPGTPFEDIVTIRAYDAAGNLIPVTLTPGADVDVAGSTATGDGDFQQLDAGASMLVEITGPVARFEVDYDNGLTGEQNIQLTDVYFETVDVSPDDPEADDDTDTTAAGSPVIVDVLDNDSDPNGDTLTITAVGTPVNGTASANPDGTITYTPNPGFEGDDSFS